MQVQMDARAVVEALVGETFFTAAQSQPNRVLEIQGKKVLVGTEESPEGEPVELRWVQRGIDLLLEHGEARIAPETFDGNRRSSFVGAVLRSSAGQR